MENKSEVQKNKILVVDDDEGMRRIIKFRLKQSGYTIETAINGRNALEVLEDFRPDLIISDVCMPEMNGYDLYKEVSSRKEYKFIPFLFLTSKADREDIIFAKKLGVDDYLTKPIDKDLMLISVEAKLARFNELKEVNSRAIEQKINDMYRTLTHELNTPISVIQGFTELSEMLLSAGKLKISELKTFLDGIKSGNDRLRKLAERVLILNSIDGGYEKHAYDGLSDHSFVDIVETITCIAYNYTEAIEERRVNLVLNLPDEGLYIKAVESHVNCILENIMDNAIKFCAKKNGKVVVDAYKEGDNIVVKIEDNGTGFPDEEKDKIFERFYQYNREKTEQQGIGIGLSLVKSLADINKLDLSVETELNKGTVFTVIFKETKVLTDELCSYT